MSCFLYSIKCIKTHDVLVGRIFSIYMSCFLYSIKCAKSLKTHDVSVGRIFSIHVMFPILYKMCQNTQEICQEISPIIYIEDM